MRVLKEELQKRFKLGRPIRCRSGWLWHLKNKPNRIIKVTQDDSDAKLGDKFDKLLGYLVEINSSSVVKVYEFGSIKIENEAPYYYHVMERLFPIPKNKDEIWIQDILFEYYYHRKSIPVFCTKNIQEFLIKIKQLKFKYNDLHSRNIMLDRCGKMKLIDLESFLK
ncbi:MAG: hypothetical protein WCT07_04170 [Candidatus Paceibacterota bacterium]|jgi:hypothetical protein